MAEKKYIELDAFIKILKETKNDCKHYADKVCCDFAIRMANLMPTADVQEVRHSKWEYEDSDIGWTDYSCNSCGNIITTVAEPNELYEYCPYCGAKMDKE